jgi:hypothetical protein
MHVRPARITATAVTRRCVRRLVPSLTRRPTASRTRFPSAPPSRTGRSVRLPAPRLHGRRRGSRSPTTSSRHRKRCGLVRRSRSAIPVVSGLLLPPGPVAWRQAPTWTKMTTRHPRGSSWADPRPGAGPSPRPGAGPRVLPRTSRQERSACPPTPPPGVRSATRRIRGGSMPGNRTRLGPVSRATRRSTRMTVPMMEPATGRKVGVAATAKSDGRRGPEPCFRALETADQG